MPQSIDELTPDFLERALGARVTDVNAEDIGVGVGVFGIIARLHLTGDGPDTIIAKFPTDADANRDVGIALGLYQREHEFYGQVAPSVPFSVPECYYSQADPEAGEYLILMQDMAHLELGDQLAGLTPERAGPIIDGLAAFHAQWWQSPELDALSWLPRQDDPRYVQAVPPIVSAGVPELTQLAHELPSGSIELARRVDANFVDILHSCAGEPRTLIHGDCRLDNIFFDRTTDEFTLIDFQLALQCRGVYDIVWLLATSMDIAAQNAHAHDLLGRYHQALREAGVDWPLEELQHAAAEHAAFLLSGPLSLLGTFDFADQGDGRAAELTRKWVGRGFNLALLYGAADVI